jgi:hypothetical protein
MLSIKARMALAAAVVAASITSPAFAFGGHNFDRPPALTSHPIVSDKGRIWQDWQWTPVWESRLNDRLR